MDDKERILGRDKMSIRNLGLTVQTEPWHISWDTSWGIELLKQNMVLVIAVGLLAFFALLSPGTIREYPGYVDWSTIITLTGLLIVTSGLRESTVFSTLARKLLATISREDVLAMFLVSLSALFSMVLTNDITLFIIVPLTLSLQEASGHNMNKMIIFEALAVNAGSMLTPIGNPQNIFLWRQWGISFFSFVGTMLPLSLLSLGGLLLFTALTFKPQPVHLTAHPTNHVDKTMLGVSLLALVGYLAAVEMHLAAYALPLIALIYLRFFRPVLKRVDWLLLLLFVVMFVDFRLVADVPFVQAVVAYAQAHGTLGMYSLGILTSQLISNVPAALLMARFTDNWQLLTYAVNIGGNGLVIGSLANLIALRMVREKRVWSTFHKYSFPYLLLAALGGWILISVGL